MRHTSQRNSLTKSRGRWYDGRKSFEIIEETKPRSRSKPKTAASWGIHLQSDPWGDSTYEIKISATTKTAKSPYRKPNIRISSTKKIIGTH